MPVALFACTSALCCLYHSFGVAHVVNHSSVIYKTFVHDVIALQSSLLAANLGYTPLLTASSLVLPRLVFVADVPLSESSVLFSGRA